MFLFLTTALAADVFPGLAQFSAVPQEDDTITVEAAAAVSGGSPWDENVGAGTISAVWDKSPELRVGFIGRIHDHSSCGVFKSCGGYAQYDALVVFGFLMIDAPESRLFVDLQAGTAVGAGLAFWTRTQDHVWTLDGTWQADYSLVGQDEYAEGNGALLTPELGLTLSPGGGNHHLRLGMAGLGANLGYRMEVGKIGLELQGGAGFIHGAHVRTAISTSFRTGKS